MARKKTLQGLQEDLKGGQAADECTGSEDENAQPDPERGLPPMYDEEPREGRRIMGGPKKEEQEINPNLAKTERDRRSEPNLTQEPRTKAISSRAERPSVREKLEGYKAEIARKKEEKAKDMVSKGIEAAIDAAKAVPVPRAPGKDR